MGLRCRMASFAEAGERALTGVPGIFPKSRPRGIWRFSGLKAGTSTGCELPAFSDPLSKMYTTHPKCTCTCNLTGARFVSVFLRI